MPFVILAFCIVITCICKGQRTIPAEIYSTLTTDTIPLSARDSLRFRIPPKAPPDTSPPSVSTIPDTSSPVTSVDTFNLKYSKDTLDAEVQYEAADSGVLLIREKKFYLYGKTRSTYKDVQLAAPKLEFDQATNILTAFRSVDSLGYTLVRAQFSQGDQGFQSDTIRFNFKNKRGLTTNTYTKQGEGIFVNAGILKKVTDSTAYISDLKLTTCDLDDPHFDFKAKKAKFINGKVAITGPVHPEFEGVPVPIYLPFGIFPLSRGRHSGLLPPQFTVSESFGIGLQGLGYYQVLNDYLDVAVRSDIYSYGGWRLNVTPTYRKRYKYQGQFDVSVQKVKYNFKGDPDYRVINTYALNWQHTVDQRARPGTNFMASVNASSSKYNENLPNNPNRNLQNQQQSSIHYSKSWAGKPYNLSLTANQTQNNATRLVNLELPAAAFTVTTLYPLQKKEEIGTPKWYEKVGIGYTGNAKNMIAFYDTGKNVLRHALDTMQYGAQHNFPLSVSLPPIGPLLIGPNITYEESWMTRRIRRQWNDITQKVDTVSDRKGLFIDRHTSFGISLNTSIFGTYQFRKGKIVAIRHVVRPFVNMSYTPTLSKKYYDVIRIDSSKNSIPSPVSQLNGFGGVAANIYSGYPYQRFGGLNFGVDNNLEMKVRSKKDTITGIKKVKLIDGFSVSSSYNFLADSFRLTDFIVNLRTTLFEKLSIQMNANVSPYQVNAFGTQVDRLAWLGNRFSLGRVTTASLSVGSSFQSKPRDPEKESVQTPVRQIQDPNVLADQERLQDYIRRNPAEFVDFNIPWTLNFSLSAVYTPISRGDGTFKKSFSAGSNLNGSFSLTPKWNFSTQGFIDLLTGQLSLFSMSVNRDMHCWQMSVNVTPVGNIRSFSIAISPKSALLQDLRINRSRYFYNY